MNQNLFKMGMFLLFLGILLGAWSVMDLGTSFASVSGENVSPSALATDIDHSIRPMIVGMPAIVVGTVLLIVNWWRSRRQRVLTRSSS